jgi:hypothetical protein
MTFRSVQKRAIARLGPREGTVVADDAAPPPASPAADETPGPVGECALPYSPGRAGLFSRLPGDLANVAVAEVGSVPRRRRSVPEPACAAVPDERRSEQVPGCIVPHVTIDHAAGAAADIVRWALRELAYFTVPGSVAFVVALPLTATNKVRRDEPRAWAQTLPGSPDCLDTRQLKRRS